MVVFELASASTGDGLRVASMGSCRVHGPLAALADRGDLRYCAFRPMFFSHTAAEALQTLDLVSGGKSLIDALSPLVFGTRTPPPLEPFRLAMKGGLDAVLVEVSHDRQFVYGDVRLQASYLSSHFIRPHGRALLPWFRELCRGDGSVGEACGQAAMEALRRGGFALDELTIDLLRRARMERHDADAIERSLKAIRSRVDSRLVVVGHIDVQGHAGAIMQDRRALNATLRAVTGRCEGVFYDPSRLVARFGRGVALDGDGADVYEYAPSFRAVVGEVLVALALGAHPERRRRSPSKGAGVDTAAITRASFAARSQLAERVNAELAELHRSRLARLGPADSGLYDNYALRLERGDLIELRERAVFELVHTYLPAYAAYGVMRAGLGEVALLLAASGRRVIAYEPNLNRRSAIEAGCRRLRAVGLMGTGSVTLIASVAPTAPVTLSVLGVGLNVGLTPRDPGTPAELERMAAFEALLVDPGFLFRPASGGEDTPPLNDAMERIGFAKRRDYPADSLAWFHR